MPRFALIRSAGLLFVRAANEGRTVIEMFPREKITADFDVLADRVLGDAEARAPSRGPASASARGKPPAPDRRRTRRAATRRTDASGQRDSVLPLGAAQRPARQLLVALAGPARRPARRRAGTGG